MSIPTGSDYHILCAKSHVHEALTGRRSDKNSHSDDQLALAIREIIKALELIQREREQEKQQ